MSRAVMEDNPGQKKAKQPLGLWWRRAFVALLCLLGICVVFVEGLRTPIVLSKVVAPNIAAQAASHGLDLRIGTMTGTGWTGLKLLDVQVAVEREGARITADLQTIELYPDLGASLRERRPVIATLVVDDGEVWLGRSSQESTPQEGKEESKEARATSALERLFAEELTLVVRALSLQVQGVDHGATLRSLEAQIDVQGQRVRSLQGHGQVMGTAFELGAEEEALLVLPDPPKMQAILRGVPVTVGLEAFAFEQSELVAALQQRRFSELRLGLRGLSVAGEQERPFEMRAERSTLSADEAAIRWSSPQARVVGNEKNYELHNLELVYRHDADGFGFQTRVLDGDGGKVDLEGQWHLPTELVELNAWMENFLWDGTLPFAPSEFSPVQEARVNGAFHGEVDLVHRLVSLNGEFGLRQLRLDLPLLARETILLEDVHMALPVTIDIRGGAVSVAGGRVRLGALAPLVFHGQLVDAHHSHAFRLHLSGEKIDAAEVLRLLPDELLGVVAYTKMEGLFGLTIKSEGHTAFPHSLLLEILFDGEVAVLGDVGFDELDTEEGAEMNFFESEHHPGRPVVSGAWVKLGELPAHVPAAILSAEDSGFFEHQGLDWKGLRMAMVHNLEAGALVRGGSTISQQVAKNVFLTHDRTLSRKLQEAFLTWRVEETLTKEQILEIYLNVAEFGPEIHGVFGAAQYYFDKPPEELTELEAVLLGSILPSPRRFGRSVKAGFLPSSREDKMRRVLVNMRFVGDLTWPQYHRALGELDAKRVGAWEFLPCADDETAPAEAQDCESVAEAGEEDPGWQAPMHYDGTGWILLTH